MGGLFDGPQPEADAGPQPARKSRFEGPQPAAADAPKNPARKSRFEGPKTARDQEEKPNWIKRLPGDLGGAVIDIPREIKHEYMEGGRAGVAGLKRAEAAPGKFYKAGQTSKTKPVQGFKDALGALADIPLGIGASLEGAIGGLGSALGPAEITSIVGRPLENLTGGKLPRETVGDTLSLAVPVAGEAAEARRVAKVAQSYDKFGGLPKRLVKSLDERLTAGKDREFEEHQALFRKNIAAAERLGAKPSTITSNPSKDARQLGNFLGQNLAVGGPIRKAVKQMNDRLEEATRRASSSLAQEGVAAKDAARKYADAFAEAIRGGKSPEEARGIASRHARDTSRPQGVQATGDMVKDAVGRFTRSTKDASEARAKLSPEARDAVEHEILLGKSNKYGFSDKADVLYERMERQIPKGGMMPMSNTQAAINDLRYRIPDKSFKDFMLDPNVADLNARLKQAEGRLTFAGARRLRTEIRSKLKADPALRAALGDAEIDNLYRAMTKDLEAGARKLGGDRAVQEATKGGAATPEQVAKAREAGGAKAERDLKRTDLYYAKGMERIEGALTDVYGEAPGKHDLTPDKIYHQILQDARDGPQGNLPRLMKLRRSLRPEEWRDVAATVLDRIDEALPSHETGEHKTSFRRSLLNFNKLDGDWRGQKDHKIADSGLKILFQGAGHGETYQDIKDIAQVASQLKEVDKLYNHSLSGAVSANAGTLAGVGSAISTAMVTGHGAAAALPAILAGLGAGNVVSRLMAEPKIAKYLAQMARERPNISMAEEIPRLEKSAARNSALIPLVVIAKNASGGGNGSKPYTPMGVSAKVGDGPEMQLVRLPDGQMMAIPKP